MRISISLLILVVATFSTQTFSRSFRWVDENGVTVYSQIPPESGDAVEISPPPPPSQPETPASQQEGSAEDGGEDDVAAQNADIRKRNCEAAKHNLNIYENLGNRKLRGADGTARSLSNEEKAQRIEATKKQIQAFCDEP